jgi:hypothetical protein
MPTVKRFLSSAVAQRLRHGDASAIMTMIWRNRNGGKISLRTILDRC